ncbi:hypothetical protein H0G86_002475 [Trichoderma simmonsii]|uniref:Uncharacterized protein n=1 Tax=Trichoderma simmonsii TaxID=1491479 RepID=A0A8G0L8U6_9HYPO|nr:hypothetical protein H0G86_002475 [Trichoderma simmonsii]
MDVEIELHPVGPDGNEFRTKPGKEFSSVVAQSNRSDALLMRANIANITHGELTPDGEPATLLIFEFRFISMQSSRRFTSCIISVIFTDANGDPELQPEVYRIAPEGVFALNKTSLKKSVTLSVDGRVGGQASPFSANAGYKWEMTERKQKDYWTRLSGTKKLLRGSHHDDAAMWSMEENKNTKDGIPTFLRTAILLRRDTDEPFSLTVEVTSEVDFMSELVSRSLFGRKKVDEVRPTEISAGDDPHDLRIESLDPSVVDLTNMGRLNLSDHANVIIATMIET